MIVKDKRAMETPFYKVDAGDCFMLDSNVFMKLDGCYKDERFGTQCNAVDLISSGCVHICPDSWVEPLPRAFVSMYGE